MKTWKQFIAGMFTVALIVSMIGTALAAGGKLQASTAGVIVMGQTKVEPGKTYTIGKENIPAVVNYEAPNGKSYRYLPVQMITDYANIWTDWSETRNSIVLASTMEGVNVQARMTNDAELLRELPRTATLGRRVGAFTEVSPTLVDTTKKPTQIIDDKTRAQGICGYGSGGTFLPENGKYILLSITNNGKNQVRCRTGLPYSVGRQERFPSMALEAGKTLTRAFQIAEGTPIEAAGFMYSVAQTVPDVRPGSRGDEIDVTITLMQYR